MSKHGERMTADQTAPAPGGHDDDDFDLYRPVRITHGEGGELITRATLSASPGYFDCGHADIQPGCGGCDPGAVEFVRADGGPWVRVTPPDETTATDEAAR